MLFWLKNKEKNIASSALALFIGSWLLFFCQTCLAMSQDSDKHLTNLPHSETIASCHAVDDETDNDDERYTHGSDHCLGVCDCNDIPASLNSIDVKHTDNHKAIFTGNIVLIPSNHVIRKVVELTYPISIFPEQAILLPQKHYTVLLN